MNHSSNANIRKLVAIATTLLLCVGLSACNGGEEDGNNSNGMEDTGPADTGEMDTGETDSGDQDPDVDSGDMDTGDTTADTDAGGGGYDFRTAGAAEFDQVDRLGMPAVSTALAGESKNAYNEGTPSDDVDGEFTTTLVTNLTAIHEWFDSDLQTLGLTPCTTEDNNDDGSTNVSDCIEQTLGADGPPVVDLVVPDTLTLDTSQDPGFPNGRTLSDPVMDITLAVLLLDVSTDAPDTFATMPLNPAQNDVGDGTFDDTFPYLLPPHEP